MKTKLFMPGFGIFLMIYHIAGCRASFRPQSDLEGVTAADDGGPNLGRLGDQSLKNLIYSGVEASLGAREGGAEQDQGNVAIGDMDSFKFTVLRLTKGGIDISGDTSQKADGMDVEVTGWYKRTLSRRDDQHASESCASFDLRVGMRRQDEKWLIKDKIPLKFGREDLEDCY